jgi:hypothetical protein
MPEPAPLVFQCVRCGGRNEIPREQSELLFGGGDAAAGARPMSRGPRLRTLIVRCQACEHAQRIQLDMGDP